MLGLIDYLIIYAIADGCGNNNNNASEQPKLSNFEQNIESIKAELKSKFYDNFLEPMIALGLAGTFVNGIDSEGACKAQAEADRIKTYLLKKMTKDLIEKQPMPFDELKSYLNMVNPHYYHVLDYVLWNTMTTHDDLTAAQKQLLRNWYNYQKSRLNFD